MATVIPQPLRSDPVRRSTSARLWQHRVAQWLAVHSIATLRISLGLVIAGFGVVKFFPGASPAESLVKQTTEALTFGTVSGTTALVATAVLETVLGLILLTGRGMRVGLVVMAGWLAAIMAPVVLFPAEMFPGGLPTLAGQYVLKDVILAAAWAVVAAQALGARLTSPTERRRDTAKASGVSSRVQERWSNCCLAWCRPRFGFQATARTVCCVSILIRGRGGNPAVLQFAHEARTTGRRSWRCPRS